jgi:arylsulfatase A-like enzyme
MLPPPPPTAENLVLICIDTVGADIFFSESIEDNLSRWLPSAQRYSNAASPAPWTIPAVASTLTGLYPVQHNAGIFTGPVANLAEEVPSALDESYETLADILGRHGFHSEAIAAHPWFRAGFGLEQGFGTVHPRNDRDSIVDRFNVSTHQFLTRKSGQQEPGQEGAPQRFFAYLHFMEAHDWHLEQLPDRRARLAALDPTRLAALMGESVAAACADPDSSICASNVVYNHAVRLLRESIADVLEKWHLLEDTLVIVYSDHGEEFWQHKAQHEARGDPRGHSYGFGHGHSMYQELLHVPMLVWHPGVEGAVHDDLVSLIDVVPSVLAWLGVGHADENLPGLALPLLNDRPPAEPGPRTVFASGIAYGPEAIATREGDMKSVMEYQGDHYEFYDLGTDPQERRPLVDDSLLYHFDPLTGDYIEMRHAAIAGTPRPEVDSEILEQLKSIGYLQGVESRPAPADPPTGQAPGARDESATEDSKENPDQ